MNPGITLFLVLLWAQLYAACVYSWRFGEYYSYGWYVPPLVALFFFRIRGCFHASGTGAPPLSAVLALAALLFPLLFALRTLNRVDPRWTLPLWIQAAVVLAFTSWAIFRSGGWNGFRRAVPVMIFACSAIPLPTSLEHPLVHHLTESVVTASARMLAVFGHQVQVVGDQISSAQGIVRVTEGCSGIRSAQSFLMASLFFGEWFVLAPHRRLILLGGGLLTAWILNVSRATTLAVIRFDGGQPAMDAWHDRIGLLTFALGSAILYLGALRLGDRDAARRTVRRVERRAA